MWLAARDLFTANKANKAIYLDNDFRQLVQGSLSIHEYCRRQKHLADALFDNDSPVSDRALVLNTLRGLGPRFASAATVISMTDPLPTFLRTRAMLLMEEMQQANAAATSANTALVAQARGPASSCTGPGCRVDGPAPGAGAGKGKQPAKQKGRTGGRQGGGATQGNQPARAPAPTGPWVCFSPGAGQWRAPSSGQGILGPRPQAYTATAPSTSATTWDSSALIAALNNLALQQGGWVMDSGASSHMTNDDGNLTRSSHLRTPHFVTVGDGTTIPITSSGFISFRTPYGHVFRLNHFGVTIRSLQTDNGTEFLNKTVDTLLTTHGTALRLSCPYTSQQNACSFVLRACAYGAARTRRPLRHAARATTVRPCAAPPAPRDRRPARLATGPHTAPSSRSPNRPAGPVPVAPAHQPPDPAPAASCPGGLLEWGLQPSPHALRPPSASRGQAQPLRRGLRPDVVPTTFRQAMQDPQWRAAMSDEYQALVNNATWSLVPRPPRANVVTGKWIFRQKFHSDGTLARNKARWVVRGYSQRPGIDYEETFSPVVKPATIRLVLHIAVSSSWPIRQLDVKNAFLHGSLDELVYCQQPPGFVDASRPHHVCRLHKSLYGLKQAPRAWYHRFASYIATLGFVASATDTSLFVLHSAADTAYLLLYVDDIIVTASSTSLLEGLLARLHSEFAMTDLGDLHYFLGMKVSRSSAGLFLSQRQYALDILQRAGMSDCHPSPTPVDTSSKLSASDGDLLPDATDYRSIVGGLQYLTLTRPDLSYAVQQACLHMHAPRTSHLALVKRVLRYVRGTLEFGLQLHASSSTALVAYSDADWAGCPDSSGYCVYFGDSLVSWSSKRQTTVSRSSAEAEYRAVAHAVAECCWLRQLLQELHRPLSSATVVYCDNVSAIYMSSNPVQHKRTKHIEIDIHFVREKVSLGEVRVRMFRPPTSSRMS
ncbi:hypothetical protein QYE76_023343 [Lolium multiflorum]|uniref:Reverse transcriptase Ty1/copia-type domain-containing protein n=1 Tax=Lolium multiflorum TaxID=4521 RepID=A0AAD8VU27_LOLMU|nr:hypothetical protein QYE76_023343 [Lolium multiflorum]